MTSRSPRKIMEEVVAAIYENDRPLWYAELKRTVQAKEYLGRKITNDTFASAIRKLREIKVIKNRNSLEDSKIKKIPICLTPEFKKRYIFGDIKRQRYSEKTAGWTKSGERYKFGDTSIPNTYLPESCLQEIPHHLTGGDRKRRRADDQKAKDVRELSTTSCCVEPLEPYIINRLIERGRNPGKLQL